jgi:hypothetical protein
VKKGASYRIDYFANSFLGTDAVPLRYHWALLIGPKVEPANSHVKRFHALERMSRADADGRPISSWQFEERQLPSGPALMVLVRVLVGKVKDTAAAERVLRTVPVRSRDVDGWNCVAWVKEAIEMLCGCEGAMASCVREWEVIREEALAFVRAKKAAHRFDGKAEEGSFDMHKVPTFDVLSKKEIVA